MAKDMIYFDKLDSRYLLKGKLVALGALHIGSGLGDNKTDARVMRLNGQPYIPGSSLKGVIRSNLERMIATLIDKDGFNYTTCLLDSDYAQELGVECVTVDSNLREDLAKKKGKEFFEELSDSLCSVCKIFGSTEISSKLKLSDAFLLNQAKTSIRDGIAVDRDTGTTKQGAKYDYEVVEKGAEFDFELIIENISEDQLGLIALGLFDLLKGRAFVGGNSSKGLGKIKLELEQIEYFSGGDDLLDYLRLGKAKTVDNAEDFLEDKLSKLLSEVN